MSIRAMMLMGFRISITDVENTVKDLQKAVDGKLESISQYEALLMMREAINMLIEASRS